MKTTIGCIIAIFYLSTISYPAEFAPSFIQIGKYYLFPELDDVIFRVLDIGDQGWILVEGKEEVFWLNTGLIKVIRELSEEQRAVLEERKRQRQAMVDMRAIGIACESFAVDHDFYPSAKRIGDLVLSLEPLYVKTLPLKDPWGTEYVYRVDPTLQSYWVISYGADGTPQHNLYNTDGTFREDKAGPIDDPKEDIVFYNGTFLRYPGGDIP